MRKCYIAGSKESKIVIFIVLLGLLAAALNLLTYEIAKGKVIKYIGIINLDSVQYSKVKADIENIVSLDMKAQLIDSGVFEASSKSPIPYRIYAISGKRSGIASYVFWVEWSFTRNSTVRLKSAVVIENGKVINSYRVNG